MTRRSEKIAGGMRAVVERHGTGLEPPSADLGGGIASVNPPALPRWDDDAGMAAWLQDRLDAEGDCFFHGDDLAPEAVTITAEGEHRFLARTPDHEAVERALELDYEPLAKLLDAGASRWVQRWVAKQLRAGGFSGRKQKANRAEAKQRILLAGADIKHIKRLWRVHFKRSNRARGMKSASAFAAERWDVPLPSLRKHLKTRHQRRKSSPNGAA